MTCGFYVLSIWADVKKVTLFFIRLTTISLLLFTFQQFLKNILAILTSIKAQEEGKNNPEQQQQAPQPAAPVKVIILLGNLLLLKFFGYEKCLFQQLSATIFAGWN